MRTIKELKQEVDRISKELDALKSLPSPEVGQVWNDVSDGYFIISYMCEVGYFAVFEDGGTSDTYRDLDQLKQSIIEDGNEFVSEHATIEGVDA